MIDLSLLFIDSRQRGALDLSVLFLVALLALVLILLDLALIVGLFGLFDVIVCIHFVRCLRLRLRFLDEWKTLDFDVVVLSGNHLLLRIGRELIKLIEVSRAVRQQIDLFVFALLREFLDAFIDVLKLLFLLLLDFRRQVV